MAVAEMNNVNNGGGSAIKVYGTGSSAEGTLASGNKTFTFSDFTKIRGATVSNKAALYSTAIVNDDDTLTDVASLYINITNISGNQVTVYSPSQYAGLSIWFSIIGE